MKVKTALTMVLATLFIMGLAVGFSSADVKGYGKSRSFVDANGDGINDNAPDSDGDGIPNGKDADYTGTKAKNGNNAKGFVDANGDGINDNAVDSDNDGIPNCQDPDYVPAGQAKKTKARNGRSVTAYDSNSAKLAPLADRIRDRLQDGSCGICDGTGFKKTRNRGK